MKSETVNKLKRDNCKKVNVDRRVCPKTLSCINAPEIPISIPRLAYKMNVLFKAEQCTQMALSAIFHFYHRYYPFINRRPTTSIKYFAVEVSPVCAYILPRHVTLWR